MANDGEKKHPAADCDGKPEPQKTSESADTVSGTDAENREQAKRKLEKRIDELNSRK